MSGTTADGFLGGRVMVRQPVCGYRAGADPVFLAAAVPAKDGETVLELGCGAGVAMLCLLARVPGARLTGIERDESAAGLAVANLQENGLVGGVVRGDVAELPATIRAASFDHVMANPPFFDRRHGSSSLNGGRESGRGEAIALSVWIDAAIRRVMPGGTLTVIQRAERLPECLAALDARVGDIVTLPLVPRPGHAAKLVVLQARKGSRGPFRLLSPFVLHTGDRHTKDGESYTDAARAILRHGAPLPLQK